jgi:phage-related baseplate assembly protein
VSGFTVVNLSGLPAPDVVEHLDFETILAEQVADMQARGDYTALVESDPAYKQMEVVPTSTGIEAESPLVEE